MSELALKILIANIAAAAAILVVIALRRWSRAAFGPGVAYALWLTVPLAAAASLLPPRIIEVVRYIAPIAAPDMGFGFDMPAAGLSPAQPHVAQAQVAAAQPIDVWTVLGAVWLVGFLAMLLWQVRNQSRFLADMRAGFAGPAVAGLFRPRIVTPADFEERYDPAERQMILTHEAIHLTRQDARINACVALVRCLAWFNPLIHLGAHLMRIDQELACDAAVARRHPQEKAAYAAALLKAELAFRPLPIGCHWPAAGEHPLTERIEMLKQETPGRGRRRIGLVALAALSLGAGLSAWAAKPPELKFVDLPLPQQASPADQMLRIVALKDALLIVRSPDGTTFVHRTLRAGESYVVRPEAGWTVTAEDGSAFEWRRGGQSLGLLGPGGPLESQSVDQAGKRLPIQAPALAPRVQPIRFEPQQTPAPPRQPVPKPQDAPNYDPDAKNRKQPPGYDGGDPVMIRGKVERIGFTDTTYTLFVRASSSSNWGGMAGEHADTTLFELSPTNFWGDRNTINSDLKDKAVWVYGLRGLDKDCKAVCKIFTIDLKMIRPTALPAISTTPGFGSADVVVRYDASKPAMIQGVVQRVDFGDRVFDAWVQIPTLSGVPGALVQVRSDYRLPRADIEKQLVGKSVYVAGWRAKASEDDVCGSPCGLYATEIRLASGDIISPAGEKLVTPSTPAPSNAVSHVRQCFREYNTAPANASMRCTDDNREAPLVDTQVYDRYARYDMDMPVTLDGRIVRVDATGWWVELIGFEPATAPGAEVGKLWYVEGFDQDRAADIGKRMSVRGYNARDKSCNPTCRMSGFGGSWIR